MLRFMTFAVMLLLLLLFISKRLMGLNLVTQAQPSSVYDFKYVDIDGKEQSLEKYR